MLARNTPSLDPTRPTGKPTARHSHLVFSILAFEVAIGGGVLIAWIVAIYAGLAWFSQKRREARPTQRQV